jgi:hypothetical protein
LYFVLFLTGKFGGWLGISARGKYKVASPRDVVNDKGRTVPQLRRLGLRDSARSKVFISGPVHAEIVVDEITLTYDSLIELPPIPVGIVPQLLPFIPLLSGRKTKRRSPGASGV